MKYLGTNITKYAQDLYVEDYKTIVQKINEWREIQNSWVGSLSIVKISMFPKSMYRLNEIPVKALGRFLET